LQLFQLQLFELLISSPQVLHFLWQFFELLLIGPGSFAKKRVKQLFKPQLRLAVISKLLLIVSFVPLKQPSSAGLVKLLPAELVELLPAEHVMLLPAELFMLLLVEHAELLLAVHVELLLVVHAELLLVVHVELLPAML
jgi:hypothetical protein